MSHYRVAVFHRPDQSVEDLLLPYDENRTVAPYIKYTKDEAIFHAKETVVDAESKTDDELYQIMCSWYDYRVDENGNIYSIYNPSSKWDYYDVLFEYEDVDEFKRYVNRDGCTYAVLTSNGLWHSPGDVGWFGTSTDTAEDWKFWSATYKDQWVYKFNPEERVTIVDCHI